MNRRTRAGLIVAALLVAFVLCSARTCAQPARSPSSDSLRILRIAATGRLWGRIKYFHPYLATRSIDWDSALVAALPRIGAASSRAEYAAAIERLLAAIGDPATHIVAERDTSTIALPIERAIRVVDGVLVVDVVALCAAEVQGLLPFRSAGDSVRALLPSARAIVLDLRGRELGPVEMPSYYIDEELASIVPAIIAAPTPAASWRYRMHSGATPNRGTTSGGYYSALVQREPAMIEPDASARALPIAVVVDAATLSGLELAGGLRSAGLAVVVADRVDPESIGAGQYPVELTEGLVVAMRTGELVGAGGAVGLTVDTIVRRGGSDAAVETAVRLLASPPRARAATRPAPATAMRPAAERGYEAMTYPSAEYRLLALFRFWNAIEYFHPYRELADEPWSIMLERFIPLFEADTDAAEYQRTVRELVAEIDDSHGSLGGAMQLAERRGRALLPLSFRRVGDEWMVSALLDSSVDAHVGDVVTSIDGESIAALERRLRPLFAASTPQALWRNMHYDLGRGQAGSIATLELRSLDGRTRTISAARSIQPGDPRPMAAEPTMRSTPVYGVLPSGFGYADLQRLGLGQVDSMFAALDTTPGLILDMRGYPRGTGWRIATHLPRRDSIGSLFSRPLVEGIALGDLDAGAQPSYGFAQPIGAPSEPVYRGRVVVLIDENAQSQSEHLCLTIESARDITFIGTPTAGANGDITNVVLPGGLIATFSGHDVRHADGRPLQRVGIQPDVRVAPTVRGLAEERDEVLEAAITFLREHPKP